MIDKINAATVRAIRFNADGSTEAFYEHLQQGQLQSTKCSSCDHIPFPPRPFCPACGGREVSWVELPRRGTLHAFTQQERSLRFGKPDVLGLVELAGVSGLVLSRIDAAFDALAIGQEVEVGFVEVTPALTLHQFSPV